MEIKKSAKAHYLIIFSEDSLELLIDSDYNVSINNSFYIYKSLNDALQSDITNYKDVFIINENNNYTVYKLFTDETNFTNPKIRGQFSDIFDAVSFIKILIKE